MGLITTILSFIAAIFPLVIIHEFGHYLVGKFLGAEPEEFSMGFGKQIWGKNIGGTLFKLSWIPLGGYVKFRKTQFAVEFGEGVKSGPKLTAWKWFFISIAGPLANFMITILILAGLMLHVSLHVKSGVSLTGQKIISVDGLSSTLRKNFLGVPTDGQVFIQNENQEYIPYVLKPEEKLLDSSLSKKVIASFSVGPNFIIHGSKETVKALAALMSPTGYKNLMGPIGIAKVSEEARTEGVVSFLLLVSSLSFAVGFFNLLPLSFLDGGRAVLSVAEVVSRRAISLQLLGVFNIVSLMIVVSLFGLGMFSDFMRLFSK